MLENSALIAICQLMLILPQFFILKDIEFYDNILSIQIEEAMSY